MQAWESRLRTAARWLTVALPILLIAGRAAADSALSLGAIFFLIRCIGTGDWSWTRRAWVRVIFGLWLWMLLISAYAYRVGPSYGQTLEWIRFILFAAAAEAWLLDEIWIRRLLFATGAALLFTAADAILQYTTGYDIFHYPKPYPTRLTGPFYPKQQVGIYMARLFFPAVFGLGALLLSRKQTTTRRALIAASAGLLVTAIFLSGERAALLLTLFGLILSLLVWQGLQRTLIAVGVLIVAGTAVYQLNIAIVQRQIDSTATTMAHIPQSPYGKLWRTGLMIGWAHPLTGVGMHNFRYVCKDPAKHYPGCNIHPHNMYIQWFAASGFPGLAGFIILVTVWLRHLWLAILRSGRNARVLGPALGVFIQLWPFIPTGGFFSNWNAVTFWLGLGWALASTRLYGAVPAARDLRNKEPSQADLSVSTTDHLT